MPAYKAPLHDIRFLMNEVLDYPAHYQNLSNGEYADADTVDMILEGAADFCENVLSPLNQSGDLEGCHFENGEVKTPKGFKEAYDQFVQGGWQGLSYPEEFGGQNLPMSLNLIKSEMMGTANWSFQMYPGLSIGCINTIMQYGTEAQKNTYLPHLVAGTWAGTMCLTEPQCGTDLGQVKTKAEPKEDGSYAISGTKIFISAGEHDLTENIVHIVLARLPDAPQGTKGISLFIVPKFVPAADGGIGERNPVTCGSIEHKMGIRASATAVLNFDNAVGYLIGEPNKGLHAMFTFMNTARIGTAIQGICHAELSFQGALPYAKERLSMRALSGKKDPEKVADAIIHHADVRRMLLTQKAIAEGGRAMIYHAAQIADNMNDALVRGDQAAFEEQDDHLGFYTPILKGFLTEMGFEAANHGVQVFGGHGYIQEWGMEQIVRDARISTLYEGTTGVQALDLIGRKVLLTSKGKVIRDYTAEILKFCGQHARNKYMRRFAWDLTKLCAQWNALTVRIMLAARKDRDIVSSASVDFLMFSGYVMMAYFWAQQAAVASAKLTSGDGAETPEFYKAKIKTADFYFERLLPRAQGHAEAMVNPSKTLTTLAAEHFSFDY
ncbi:acyl-CoA dehydrogenase [Acinetobacter sp. RF15A]|uniref:acyl-CoA dehydrogenase C-terminal domain-containing protein n=2 Tax=Acinetobacter TaxID=469 RepID=UPI00116A89E4|nr:MULTISPECIES: acyl-CoA dehydrogenase C-terminal domain-containing protein [unclassified Acinetobacter]MDM1781138.1 acyl-CoA dehydrogenase C-terminal domain-containing protein [Acinetobacter indicus]QKQ70904.1 acyl-CoA dehydrogenase [Acinetobacter sp. 10FS3-1]TQR61476.1 acyl-CoA dehydrogenase [Acinetobacter sp. RF14B]TSH77328.1 acyl-CoA dehydrogenase [Acinetobacter sp. RF15A]TSI19337.1 acyl-CoA dehydrogenase [Acinetobacter sp. RF15B]